jgi:hypothetical protein
MMFVYLISLVLGFVMMFFTIKDLNKKFVLFRNGKIIEAHIVAFKESEDTDTEAILYQPILKFLDKSNKEQSLVYPIAEKSKPTWKIGQKIQIIYNETSQNARVLHFGDLFVWTFIGLGSSITCILIGGGFFIFKTLYSN